MKPSRWFVVAALLLVARAVFHLAGVDDHACVVSGMLISSASLVLGPLAVLVAIATPIVAPICIAVGCVLGVLDRVAQRTRERAGLVRARQPD